MRTAGITQWCMMIRVGMKGKLVLRRGKLVKVLMRVVVKQMLLQDLDMMQEILQ